MWRALLAAVAAGIVLSACAPLPPAPTLEAPAPANFPEREYRQAAAAGQSVYRIDEAASIVVIEVRRGGSLARLGHDHVVASRQVRGYVLPAAGRADLYVPLGELSVDEPELRAAAHFDTTPSAADIAGTRRNMLGRVLDVEHHPFAQIHVLGVRDDDVDAEISLHGTTRMVRLPIRLTVGADRLDATGELTLRQSDYGIVPLSILGGAVQVQDEIGLRFTLRARRLK